MVVSARSRPGGDGVGDGAPIFFLPISELDLVNNQRRIYLFRRNESIRALYGLWLLRIYIYNYYRSTA